jgi:SpoVK/Ycf46/Vps4 family AAA+-type ATPase
MANAEQLKALIRSHLQGDDEHFYAVAMQLAAHQAKLGHGKLAEELRAIIDDAKSRRSVEGLSRKPVPINQPRGELTGLLQVSYPQSHLTEMVLDGNTAERLRRILKEQRNFAKIQQHGLAPRRKLLLVGPPGTGKTLTAAALAGELGIPLFLVRLDALITKFMGETAAKLRQIFGAISEVRGVYFFDEFDAIGSHRGSTNDVGEMRRVLNSFLQMIEQDGSNSVIVAATNHPEILDYALFRRFDDVVEYRLPQRGQIISVLKSKLSYFGNPKLRWGHLGSIAQGLSYAEITRVAEEAIKDAIIHDRTKITEAEIEKILGERLTIKGRKSASA